MKASAVLLPLISLVGCSDARYSMSSAGDGVVIVDHQRGTIRYCATVGVTGAPVIGDIVPDPRTMSCGPERVLAFEATKK